MVAVAMPLYPMIHEGKLQQSFIMLCCAQYLTGEPG